MGPSYCLRGVLLTLIISLAFPKCAHAQNATEHEIIWQFQRDGGIRLYGDTLERQLGTINMVVGDTLRFSWGGFGELHGLYQTESDTEFNTCSTGSGSVLAVNIQASIVVSPEAGTFYFFDHISENCAEGLLRIQVNVFSQADFVPDTTTPAASVVETTQNPENAVVVDWQPGTDFDLVDVSEDEGVRFVWSSTAQFVVTQVTEQSFNDCDMRSGILRRWTSAPSTTGNVFVSGLPVGISYFVSSLPGHCALGMRVRINVFPGSIRLHVKVWSDADTVGSEVVTATYTGVDDLGRVWTSPARQVNQRATIDNHSAFETVAITPTSNFFEMFALDVGTIVAVRLQRDPASTWGGATYVQVRKPDADAEPSQTFRCSAMALPRETTDTADQYCVAAADRTIADTCAAATTASREAENCTCFREFLVVEDRVLVCTSDGCFSTGAAGTSGWSDMGEVAHVHGLGSDGRVYGTSPANRTLSSADAGLTWAALAYAVPPLATPALQYTFDVRNLTTTPLDAHVVDGDIMWGVSSQGVHYNAHGTWELHGMWACDCNGACGQSCNQPQPHLL
eukprot:m.825978 g.825978  ORF g.825978 m.825978 type:complete len:566 (+) comp23410_c0_seq4:261-1958(+)